ncbi:MAG TPA: VTT domain-containing protein [candidate division Zixibacteria bacterium]|nr:VTT domain-containing protein [candidate division Zixibacteria bacterium]
MTDFDQKIPSNSALKDDFKNKIEFDKQENNTNSQKKGKKIWLLLTENRQRIFSVAFLLLFIAFMIYLGVSKIDPTKEMLEIVFWFQDKTGNIGLYIGVGVISIFGNFVMFIPVLYAAVLMFVAMMDVNIFILGIAAGIGASIGQIFSWFVGRATGEIASGKFEKQLRKTQKWVERGLAPIMIFIFAATPLPDEVLLIMIGLIGYSLGKTLIYCFIGKIVLTLSISILAQTLSSTIFGNWILDVLFGLTREMLLNQELPTETNIWTSIAVWIIAATLVALVAFVDWVEIYDKRICKREQQQLKNIFGLLVDSSSKDYNSSKIDEIGQLNSKILTIDSQSENKKQLFPDQALWFFEEKISKKKDVFLRKSLIDISIIAGKEISVSLNEEWLKAFRGNLTNSKFKKIITNELIIIKYPEGILETGFLPSESKLVILNSKLRYILGYSNYDNLIQNSNLKRNEKNQLLRKKISAEFLIETIPNGKTKIWAIGLKEGTYINKIKEYSKISLLYCWLQILVLLKDNPELVTELSVYSLKLSFGNNKKIEVSNDILSDCPI